VVEAGLAQIISGGHAIDDSMTIEPAPGHTPGHVLMKLADGGKRGLFCGDILHHAIQVHYPHWNSAFCEDQAQARITRRSVLEHCADQGATLFPTHFGKPFVADIQREGDGFLPKFRKAD
jgi:glyoxylase-like metal-dependent hydrolase (beta-lactamase superfamily II)